MTPYEKAQQLLEQLVDSAPETVSYRLPALRYAQIGTPVVAAEAVTVAVTGMTPDNGLEQFTSVVCDAVQLATIAVIVSRTCSWTSDDTGIDDPVKIAATSQLMDTDGTVLWDFAQAHVPYLSKQWSLTWALTGGLGITTLNLTTGID